MKHAAQNGVVWDVDYQRIPVCSYFPAEILTDAWREGA
jgi:hypothetical protein